MTPYEIEILDFKVHETAYLIKHHASVIANYNLEKMTTADVAKIIKTLERMLQLANQIKD